MGAIPEAGRRFEVQNYLTVEARPEGVSVCGMEPPFAGVAGTTLASGAWPTRILMVLPHLGQAARL